MQLQEKKFEVASLSCNFETKNLNCESETRNCEKKIIGR